MSGHSRVQRTLRSPYRRRTLHKRERRARVMAELRAGTMAPPELADRLIRIQRQAARMPGLQLRNLFGRSKDDDRQRQLSEGMPDGRVRPRTR